MPRRLLLILLLPLTLLVSCKGPEAITVTRTLVETRTDTVYYTRVETRTDPAALDSLTAAYQVLEQRGDSLRSSGAKPVVLRVKDDSARAELRIWRDRYGRLQAECAALAIADTLTTTTTVTTTTDSSRVPCPVCPPPPSLRLETRLLYMALGGALTLTARFAWAAYLRRRRSPI